MVIERLGTIETCRKEACEGVDSRLSKSREERHEASSSPREFTHSDVLPSSSPSVIREQHTPSTTSLFHPHSFFLISPRSLAKQHQQHHPLQFVIVKFGSPFFEKPTFISGCQRRPFNHHNSSFPIPTSLSPNDISNHKVINISEEDE